jgi:uncharacterized protein (TIGR03435 family)
MYRDANRAAQRSTTMKNNRRNRTTLAAMLWVTIPVAAGAAAEARFQDASITLSHSRNARIHAKVDQEPGQRIQLTLENVSLKFCVQQAYQVEEYQVTGPASITGRSYNISATLPSGSSLDQTWLALQTLLSERFQLVTRRESREMPVYALTVSKKEPSLEPSAALDRERVQFRTAGKMGGTEGSIQMDHATLADFAANLTRSMSQPVIDATGIAGMFDFALTYGGREPSMTAAVEKQFGLKLESRKASVEVLVVESALRQPAAEGGDHPGASRYR